MYYCLCKICRHLPELITIKHVQTFKGQQERPIFQSDVNGENKALWMPFMCSCAGNCHLVTRVSSFTLAAHPAHSDVAQARYASKAGEPLCQLEHWLGLSDQEL